MRVTLLPSSPCFTCSNPHPIRFNVHNSHCWPRQLSIKLSAASPRHNPCPPAGEFIRQLSVSTVLVMGLGLSSLSAFSSPASARILPASITHLQDALETGSEGNSEFSDNIEDVDMKVAFERWKSKSYALSVPLRIVALQGSVPAVWIGEFSRSQGKRARLGAMFRQSLADIYREISHSFSKRESALRSAAAADLVTLGDSWLDSAIGKKLIEPIEGAEDQDWFQILSYKWKVYLRRSDEGNLDSQGRIWAAPYRWGSMVIAYNKKEFQKRKLAPIEDWSDLWRPELAGKISMVDSPREVIGATLKYMGASYNTTNMESQIAGGKHAVLQQLELLVQQVLLFDTQHYLKAFKAGEVWVAVGWSCDVLPVAKTMSNISVIVPNSGTSLWADFWAIPNSSRLVSDRIGGRIRGPSPLVQQWIEFCLQPERAIPFKEGITVGASPISLNDRIQDEPQEQKKGRPKLETNLVGNRPPAEILSKCEFLEPLSEDTVAAYQWLISSLPRNSNNIMNRLRLSISSMAQNFLSKCSLQLHNV